MGKGKLVWPDVILHYVTEATGSLGSADVSRKCGATLKHFGEK